MPILSWRVQIRKKESDAGAFVDEPLSSDSFLAVQESLPLDGPAQERWLAYPFSAHADSQKGVRRQVNADDR